MARLHGRCLLRVSLARGETALGARFTLDGAVTALFIVAVRHALRRLAAVGAASDYFCLRAEVHRLAVVENVERPLPQAGVSEALAVADDSSVELVYLVETARNHKA